MAQHVADRQAGAGRLLQLRQQSGRSQLLVEAEAELGSGYVQRIESGKVRQPLRPTLERLLAALDTRYSERREVLALFGYQSATPLPEASDIGWAREAVQPELEVAPVPAYLLDCATRLLAWNRPAAALFPPLVQAKEQLTREHWSMLRLLFAPEWGIAARIERRDMLLRQLLNTLRHEFQRIGDEPWIAALLAELAGYLPEFAQAWQASSALATASTARSLVQVGLTRPDGGVARFWLTAEPLTRDQRFRIIYLLPLDAATAACCASPGPG